MKSLDKDKASGFLLRKSKASTVVSDMIPVLLTMILTGMLALCYASWISNFEAKERLNAIAREYILRMSTVGYLTEQDRASLLEELQACEMENISLTGTTESQVESGGVVTLKISGEYSFNEVTYNDVFSWKADDTGDSKKEFEIEKCTTAIY